MKEIKAWPGSYNTKHRHPHYPDAKCGVQVVVLPRPGERPLFQQLGRRRRKCWNCGYKLRQEDLR